MSNVDPPVRLPSQGLDANAQPLHPTSLLFMMTSLGKQSLLPILLVAYNAAKGGWYGLIGIGALLLIFLTIVLIRYLTFRYQLIGGELVVTEGILFRSKRNVPVDRIQNVDLVQNLFHRILGVAEVRVETASGTKPEAVLRVLSVIQVDLLKERIEASRKQTDSPADALTPPLDVENVTPIAATMTLLSIPTKWLVQAGLASNRGFVMVGIAVGVFGQTIGESNYLKDWMRRDWRDEEQLPGLIQSSWWTSWITWALLLLAVLVLIRILGIAWYVLRFSGYKLELRDENLHLSCGLLTKVSATIPRRRIQWISIHRTPIQRWMGLASIRIETAGGSGKQNENAAATVTRRWFVPVIPDQQIDELMNRLRPGMEWSENELNWQTLDERAARRMKRKAFRFAVLLGCLAGAVAMQSLPWHWAASIGLATAAVSAIATRQIAIRRHRWFGFGELTSDVGVVIRSGIWTRKTSCTFYDRVQSVACSESPFDRRWKMQTLRLDTAAAGPADHVFLLKMLPMDVAKAWHQKLSAKIASVDMVWS